MNEYVFYSLEGETIAPNNEVEVDNCQVLGRVKACNAELAECQLLRKNPWIGEAGFDMTKTIREQIVTEQQKEDIMRVVKYLWNEEKCHFLENGLDKNHIFRVLCRLRNMCN